MVRFDKGIDPVITCINRAKEPLGIEFRHLISILQRFLDEHFAPVWGASATLRIARKPVHGTWTLFFYDTARDAEDADDAGYHLLTYRGQPRAFVFVKPTIETNDKVSVTASHELAELLVDPAINLWADNDRQTRTAYEVCDAVEEDEFVIDGVPVTNFVYPAYFEAFRKPRSTQFDEMGLITRPLELRPGGYNVVVVRGHSKERFGSAAKRKRFRKEDRRLHRTEYRLHRVRKRRRPRR